MAASTTELAPERPYDDADISSVEFWSAAERERVFAELRADRPVSWHRPVQNALFDDPNDRGFWAVVRHADVVEVTRRHNDFLSGEGVVFESLPQELLDAGQGFIAMDPPRHTKIRRLLTAAFTPKQMARIEQRLALHNQNRASFPRFRATSRVEVGKPYLAVIKLQHHAQRLQIPHSQPCSPP